MMSSDYDPVSFTGRYARWKGIRHLAALLPAVLSFSPYGVKGQAIMSEGGIKAIVIPGA